MKIATRAILSALMGAAVAGTAGAAQINIGDSTPGNQAADLITTSTTWTANNTYNLRSQIYVMPGATLTIEPGTVIASVPTANGAGSLAITRGAKIIAQGTAENPIIFTSTADVATWDGSVMNGNNVVTPGDPTTGNWRVAANEWGNLTLLGRAFVANTIDIASNTPTPNASNISPMEGLIASTPGDPNVVFGGGDDDDDSGTIAYVSIRYGGRVIGLGDELNGLSLGGIGRETDIHHVEIMNNVDDGIEIWGGTVNLKHVSIWNVGDDSFDVDQGWRGKAQFGLIVQGYSLDAAQGSGIGDNIFETDGAENSDAQPVTTAAIYNFTVIGQPVPGAGDHATAWRDNARIQYRNCIFMDLGDRLINFENSDGEGSQGYGFNGTLTWTQTWNTDFDNVPSHPNDPDNPATFYAAQSAGDPSIGQGKLAEMTDCVFFRNVNNAYSNANGANALGVTINGGSNPAKGNVVAPFNQGNPNANMPIAGLTRGEAVFLQGMSFVMLPVTSLDPRAANAATTSIAAAPSDGFFTPAQYRGGFSATENWLCGWSASSAFGFVVDPPGGCVLPATCPADFTGGGEVNAADLAQLLGAWSIPVGTPGCGGATPCAPDLNRDTFVNAADLALLLGAWGECE